MHDAGPAAAPSSHCDILIHVHGLSGGAGRNAVLYANTLSASGWKVTLAYDHDKGEGIDATVSPDVTLTYLKARRTLAAIRRTAAELRETRPARALVIGPTNMVRVTAAAILARYDGKIDWRISNSPLGMLTRRTGLRRILKTFFFRKLMHRTERIIALNHDMARELTEHWGVPGQRVSVIHNAVRLPEQAARPAPSQPPVILCVARLHPQKDHATLLRAFALLRQRRDCRLQLAGDGPLRADLEHLAQQLGLERDVSFLGHVTDVAPLYRSASVTVLSSRYEGFGLVLIESLAHGTPLVATNCPTGPAEVINSPAVGLLCEPGNAAQLADCLDQALSTEYQQKDLLARAADFSEAETARRIRSLYGLE